METNTVPDKDPSPDLTSSNETTTPQKWSRKAKIKRKISETDIQSTEEATYPHINLKFKDPNIIFSTNQLVTTKYTLWNFIPKNLFEQFRRATNIFFLFITVVCFVPQISPISPVTTLLGLLFVLLVAAINDGYQDFVRFTNSIRNY